MEKRIGFRREINTRGFFTMLGVLVLSTLLGFFEKGILLLYIYWEF